MLNYRASRLIFADSGCVRGRTFWGGGGERYIKKKRDQPQNYTLLLCHFHLDVLL